MNSPLRLTDPNGLQAGTQLSPCDGNNCEYTRTSSDTVRANSDNIVNVSIGDYLYDTVIAPIQSSISTFFSNPTNSNPILNHDNLRFQTIGNAMSGSAEAADFMNQGLVGNQGASAFSVMQQTSESYNVAEQIGETNVAFQSLLLTVNPAGYVGGASTVSTNRGFSTSSPQTKLFFNKYPEDMPRPTSSRQLSFDGNKWRATGTNGSTITPNGRYNFVVQNDNVSISRLKIDGIGGHVDLSRGKPVHFA